jgi:hypothetical protein
MASQHSRSRPIGNQGRVDETAWHAGSSISRDARARGGGYPIARQIARAGANLDAQDAGHATEGH